jgi:TolB protein
MANGADFVRRQTWRRKMTTNEESRVTTLAAAFATALVVSMLVLVAMASEPADAAFPGKNGKIAFVKESFRSSGIFTINPDGSGQQKIGSGYSPSWSADGQKVVFERFSGESEEDFDQDIFVMDADGTDVRQMTGDETNDEAYDFSPSFSPDGGTIAFVRGTYEESTDTETADIFTVDIDSGEVTNLTNTPTTYEGSPVYSPDGSQIAFSMYGSTSSDIFVMNSADGSDQKNLTKTGRIDEYGPDWSPDGSKLIFTSYRFSFGGGEPNESSEIAVMNPDGTQRKNLTESAAYEESPTFSPNGRRIVFSRYSFSRAGGESSDIFVMRADGTGGRRLTDTRAFEWQLDWQPLPQ